MEPVTHSARQDRCTHAEAERLGAFVDDLRKRGRAPKTVESYRSDWTGFADWYHQHEARPFDLQVLEGWLVCEWRDHLQGAGMRPSTINRKLVFLKRYASWAQGAGDIGAARVADIRSVDAVAQAARRPKGLSDLELRRFLKEVERRGSRRDQAIVYGLLETGLRVSELVSLEMAQLVLSARKGHVVLEEHKHGSQRERRVQIGPVARRRLRAYLEERGSQDGPLFLGERGPLTANAVQRIVRKFCRFAKVKVSPGTLRHTFATAFLAQSDGDLVALADVLGHESLETTRLYLTGGDEGAPTPPDPTQERIRPIAIPGGRA